MTIRARSSRGSDRRAGDVIARVALALVAVVVVAWLAVMERDTRLQSQGLKLTTAGKIAGAEADFRGAAFLNPDSMPDLLRSVLYLGRGERQRAADGVEQVLRREPDNIIAWSDLVLIEQGHDPGLVRRASAEVRRLDPLGLR